MGAGAAVREKDEKKKIEHPFRAFSPTTEPDPRLVIVIILQIHSVIRFARLSHNTVVNKYRTFSKPKFIFFVVNNCIYFIEM